MDAEIIRETITMEGYLERTQGLKAESGGIYKLPDYIKTSHRALKIYPHPRGWHCFFMWRRRQRDRLGYANGACQF